MYRTQVLLLNAQKLVERGDATQDEVDRFSKYLDAEIHANVTKYLYTAQGKLKGHENDSEFQNCHKIMKKLGLADIPYTYTTAAPPEH